MKGECVIPRRFFWLLDALMLGLAFLAAYALVPVLHTLTEPGNILYLPWVFSFFSPIPWAGQLPPVENLAWVYLSMVTAVLLVLTAFNDYGQLLYQSRTRIVGVSMLATLFGIGLLTLVIFAFKSAEWSRLFVVSYLLLSALGLSAYRLALRSYFVTRQHMGIYARNVLLVGQKSAVDWMAQYFQSYVSPNEYNLLGQLCVNGDEAVPAVPCLGHVDELGDLLIRRPIQEVIAVQSSGNGHWIEGVIQACDYMGVLLRIVPEVLLRDQHTLKSVWAHWPAMAP
jgi:FlaA1/EpsC-like NDP-sugar epimerase